MNSRSKKQGLVWGGLLILFGAMALVQTFADLSALVWVAALAAGGVGVYGIYATDRTEKWPLIVSYAMFAAAVLVALLTLNVLQDPFIATFVLLAIALPFLVAFLQSDRTKWGLLIPAYVLLAVSVMVPLTETGILDDTLVAAYVLFAVAIPFFIVYARDSEKWWALIPGGITAVVGLSFLIAEKAAQYTAPVILIIAGAWVLVRQFTRKED
jgi:uncharacterized protein YybS (DUF2232 family)